MSSYHKPEIFITEQRDMVGRVTWEGLIYRYRVIGTNLDVYEVWEPRGEQHTSLRSFEGFDGTYGQVGVGGDHKRREFSENLILRTLPECRNGNRDSGRIRVVRDDV